MKTAVCWARGLILVAALVAPSNVESADLDSLRTSVEEVVEDVTVRCRYDLETYCATVTPGEGRLAFCLTAHADKRSPRCEYALFDARRAVDSLIEHANQASESCRSDIAALCSGANSADGRVAKCLADQKPALSKRCSEVLDVVGKAIFPTHNQPFAESTQPARPDEITKSTINSESTTIIPEASKGNCRTLETSVTDWGKDATSRDARKLLKISVAKYAARHGINGYKSEDDSVTCSTNVDLVIASSYTCRARTRVCWTSAEAATPSPIYAPQNRNR